MGQLVPFRCGTLLRDFLDCQRVKGLSPANCANHLRTMTDFLRFLRVGVREVEDAEINRYLSQCYSQGLSSSSIAGRVSVLRQFFLYLQTERGMRNDPMLRVEAPKQTKLMPRVLSRDEARQLVEQEPSRTSAALSLRDRAIIELLYASGIRNSELRKLCCLDLRLKDRILMVRDGKGSCDRLVPFGLPTQAALSAYLSAGRPILPRANTCPYLFVNSQGAGPLSRTTVRSIIRRQGEAAGIPRAYPHKMRHSCASHMIEGGADIRSVQRILGHASVETTEIYTHVSPVHLRKQMNLHPRGHPETLGRVQLPPGYSKCVECLSVAETGKIRCGHHLREAALPLRLGPLASVSLIAPTPPSRLCRSFC